MTNATPPGWYPDPWNPSAQRFWDGTQWTEHAAPTAGGLDRPRLPDGAPIYGPLIWVLALLPLLAGVYIWFVHVDISQYVSQLQQLDNYDGTGPMPDFNPFAMFGPGYWVMLALSPLLYAAQIVLAVFDQRRLERLGVVRPFHWAWAFLSGIVYVIGRSVIVRKVAAPRGLAAIWVMIAAYVVTMISSAIWAAGFVGALTRQLNELTGNFPTS
ncbi:DUF2510 domain-containing protein [Gryllotalpicola daejeonensis]|uniref:DUF2510 domain-containing protein n=1 Tax=Gryllotalpicola daejeonensis TaxID=993087 RepID=UPI0031D3058F